MKQLGGILFALSLLWGGALWAAVNAVNGVTVSTSSTINGRSSLSAINGQTLASSGPTTPTFDAVVTSTNVSGNTFTGTLSAGALTNGCVLVKILNFNATTSPSSVIDGDATSYTEISTNTTAGIYTGVWRAAKGTRSAGNLTMTVTFGAAPGGGFAMESFNGVLQAGPNRTVATTEGTPGPATHSVTTVSGDLVSDYVISTDTISSAAGGQTSRFNTDLSGVFGAGSTKTATTTSTSTSWTLAGTPDWLIFLVPLVPAS